MRIIDLVPELLLGFYARLHGPDDVRPVVISPDLRTAQVLEEGKWISKDIRIDRNTHMLSGDEHAHLYDRKNRLIGIVTKDGRPSHGAKRVIITQDHADKLRARGFIIPLSNIVECTWFSSRQVLLG